MNPERLVFEVDMLTSNIKVYVDGNDNAAFRITSGPTKGNMTVYRAGEEKPIGANLTAKEVKKLLVKEISDEV